MSASIARFDHRDLNTPLSSQDRDGGSIEANEEARECLYYIALTRFVKRPRGACLYCIRSSNDEPDTCGRQVELFVGLHVEASLGRGGPRHAN